MPELFLELFSEEIPARMQARAAEDLQRLMSEALAGLSASGFRTWFGPRRIALAANVAASVPATRHTERGPRANAPEAALAGFLRKHNATRDQLRQEGEFFVLDRETASVSAAELVAGALPALLRRFPWPKSMRWGGTSAFTWVRPLRRIVCVLDGSIVNFSLAQAEDDGHGLVAGNVTEGHRFMAPCDAEITGAGGWIESLEALYVVVDAAERERLIAEGLAARAEELGVSIVPDEELLREVAGLVEWPVPLVGRIDVAFMDLPPEVMQVSMRVNQRYFATRRPDGRAAPYFAFAANIEAEDGGAAIIAGNERVLRARFADARHFWDLDRRTNLADRVAALDGVTFHAALGSQGDRVRRLVALTRIVAEAIGADVAQAARAALLAKADLTTGMVGEFPELQGVMGGYYARHDGEADEVADAVRDHYLPRGAADETPRGLVSIAVALADRIDQLACFFAIGEKPSGSGDPYALRRAALGIIRTIRDHGLRLNLLPVLRVAASAAPGVADADALAREILGFTAERLRVQLRAEGARHDVLSAVFAAGEDDDVLRLLTRSDAVASMLSTDDGRNLLAAYKRAANILRIEEKKDGPHRALPDAGLLQQDEERALHAALISAEEAGALIEAEQFAEAMTLLSALRAPLDAFFDRVTVNAPEPALRLNRLRLLASLRRDMNRAADFSAIEG